MLERSVLQLQDALAAVKKETIAGCTGITTFIKTELVADGKSKPAVKPPQGAAFAANASSAGLCKGRKFDAAFQKAVSFNDHTAATQQAFRTLRQTLGVIPINCQHRVTMKGVKLTTQIDSVGICERTRMPVCIELKTCQLSSRVYPEYAATACRRTPMLRCTPELPNSERSRHFLQAAFGAECLRQQLGVEKVIAVVLVKCRDTCLAYRVPTLYHAVSRFVRLPPVPVARRATQKTPAPYRSRSDVQLWPANKPIPAVKSMGFAQVNVAGAGKKKFKLMRRGTHVTGVASFVPTWNKLSASKRQHVCSSIAAYIKSIKQQKSLAHISLSKTITPLVLTTLTLGGRLQLVMAGPPFTVQYV